MERYYCPDWTESTFLLSEEESKHCWSVMRNKNGSRISVMDGMGNKVEAEILGLRTKRLELRYIQKEEKSPMRHPLHIAISPTKSNDRIEWFLEKACEIGIGQITPLICQRTERKRINLERWQKIIISACKQSGLLYFPTLGELFYFNRLQNWPNLEKACLASIGAEKTLGEIRDRVETIFIGPEGDFSEEELTLVRQLKLREVSLSQNILRVETAGLVAASIWNS